MKSLFTRKTFQYFVDAKKKRKQKDFLAKNQKLYIESVKEPFQFLLADMSHRFSPKLPGVIISPRKLCRPLRAKDKAEAQGYTRASANFFLSEKTTSMFEWNPGLYMQLGDEKEDNVIGMGLYGPSSRQIKRLRKAFVADFRTVDRLLADRKLRKYWGSPANEKYVRFPKDYSPEDPGAKYLWYKQFFLRHQFTRKEATGKEFADTVMKSFEAGIPLFQWIRAAVGVYDRREQEREKAERADRERGE
jgi:uncharacterized protein (DUF2461 family)